MSQEESFEKKRMEAIKRLIAVHRLHRSFCEHRIGGIGIHRGQHQMLMYLARQKEIPSQKQIADRLEISPAAVAVMLKKLENGGYVERKPSKTDNRYNEIFITDKGRQIIEQSTQEFSAIDQIMFENISEDEIVELTKTLDKVCLNIKQALNRDHIDPETLHLPKVNLSEKG